MRSAGETQPSTLARVYRTSEGLLFVSEFVVPRDQWPTYQPIHADAIVVHDPSHEWAAGRPAYSTAHWTTRISFEALRAEHERVAAGGAPGLVHSVRLPGEPYPVVEAPAGIKPVEEREQTKLVRVRFLLDRDNLDHDGVTLRVKCHRLGTEARLDRAKVLAAAPPGDTLRHLPVCWQEPGAAAYPHRPSAHSERGSHPTRSGPPALTVPPLPLLPVVRSSSASSSR